MMTLACPRLLDMINDFVLLRFWARAPRWFKRYRNYIIIIIIIILYGVYDGGHKHCLYKYRFSQWDFFYDVYTF